MHRRGREATSTQSTHADERRSDPGTDRRRRGGDRRRRVVGNQTVARLADQATEGAGGVGTRDVAVSAPGDARERAARRVAERVARSGPAAGRVEASGERTGPAAGRAQASAECDGLSGDATAGAEPRERTGGDGAPGDGAREASRVADSGGGRPLPGAVRTVFEERMGEDFGDVRVHTGNRADAAARSVDATAFTVGRHVVFRSGAYRPETPSGTRLLAHELAHVQQARAETSADPVVRRQGTGASSTDQRMSRPSQQQSRLPSFLSDPLPCGEPLEVWPIAEYMRSEMLTNQQSDVVARMRELNAVSAEDCIRRWQQKGLLAQIFGPGPEHCSRMEMNASLGAMSLWASKVRDGGPWDHKPMIGTQFASEGLGSQAWFQLDKWGYYYDIWSNIHYGYVGAAAGFSKGTLLDGAGIEHIGSTVAAGNLPERSEGVAGMRAWDDPSDRLSVELGYDFFPGVPSVPAMLRAVLGTSGLSRNPASCCDQNPDLC